MPSCMWQSRENGIMAEHIIQKLPILNWHSSCSLRHMWCTLPSALGDKHTSICRGLKEQHMHSVKAAVCPQQLQGAFTQWQAPSTVFAAVVIGG